jgi:predicted enzyme related to lactoylglutathione lyase
MRVCIDVNDVEAAVAFYGRALGLTPGRRFDDAWVELAGGPCPIDLLENPPGGAPVPDDTRAVRDYARHWTPVHLDFVVEDLDAAVERAVAAGAKVERDVERRRWGRIVVLADPFGHGFCLLEFRGRGYDELSAR